MATTVTVSVTATALRVIVTGTAHPLAAAVAVGLRGGPASAIVATYESMPAHREIATVLVRAEVERMGGLDALVLASWHDDAAAARPIEALDDASFSRIWDDGMLGLLWPLQAAIPALRESGGAVVVLIPTTALTGGADYSATAAMFEAQRVLVKAAARQLGPDRIRVNAVTVAPELVLDDAEAADVHYLAPAAISQVQQPGDAVSVVRFLIGADAKHLTGQSITVDGGRWMAP